MVRSLDIQNFKSFGSCKIAGMSRVNLFVGKNNVGKSTLLEALSVLFSDGSLSWVHKLLSMRGYAFYFRDEAVEDAVELEKQSIASLYTGRDVRRFEETPLTITAETDSGARNVRMQIVRYVEEIGSKGNVEFKTRKFISVGEDADGEAVSSGLMVEANGDVKISVFDGKGLSAIRRQPDYAVKFEFVKPSSTFSPDNAELFDRIAMTDLQQSLVEALNIIEPRIKDINFLNDRVTAMRVRVPIVVFNGSDERIQLRSMGDGINRLLTIVLSMLNCKGGVLLVDEFENGLHHTTMRKLWEMIFKLAANLDIQVFATTHSDDCVKSFIEADDAGDGVIVRLERRGERVVSVPYTDREELSYIEQNDVEIR